MLLEFGEKIRMVISLAADHHAVDMLQGIVDLPDLLNPPLRTISSSGRALF